MPTDPGQHPDEMGAACRLAIHHAMAGDEPLVRPGIIGGALRDARRIRRRRWVAAAGALAAIVPAMVIGIAAVQHGPGARPAYRAGTLAAGAPRASVQPMAASSPSVPSASVTPASVTPASQYPLERPGRPATTSEVDPEPITAQSLGQLLIDVLPPGASHSQVMASVDADASGTGLSLANFDEVTTPLGTGSVSVQLIRATKPGSEFDCGTTPVGERCQTYRPGGGVEVNETVIDDSWEIGSTMLAVTVYRPATGIISIEEGTGIDTGSSRPPLTLGQLVQAALDPRWGFTIGGAFLKQASSLQVAAANQG